MQLLSSAAWYGVTWAMACPTHGAVAWMMTTVKGSLYASWHAVEISNSYSLWSRATLKILVHSPFVYTVCTVGMIAHDLYP